MAENGPGPPRGFIPPPPSPHNSIFHLHPKQSPKPSNMAQTKDSRYPKFDLKQLPEDVRISIALMCGWVNTRVRVCELSVLSYYVKEEQHPSVILMDEQQGYHNPAKAVFGVTPVVHSRFILLEWSYRVKDGDGFWDYEVLRHHSDRFIRHNGSVWRLSNPSRWFDRLNYLLQERSLDFLDRNDYEYGSSQFLTANYEALAYYNIEQYSDFNFSSEFQQIAQEEFFY